MDQKYCYYAECLRVVDGDTVDLLLDLGLSVHVKERVRLYGIDTPEVYGVKKDSDEYAAGMKASVRAKELMEGKTLLVETIKDKKGKYGRYLAMIYYDGPAGTQLCVNDILVEEGLAERKIY